MTHCGSPSPLDATATNKGGHRRKLGGWIRLAVSLAMLVFLISWLPTGKIFESLSSIPPLVWIASLLAYLTLHCAAVAKWGLLLDACRAGVAWPLALRAYFSGLFGNLFLPSVVGGDTVTLAMTYRQSTNRAGLVLGTVISRAFDLGSVMLLGLVGLVFLPVHGDVVESAAAVRIANVGLVIAVVGGLVAMSVVRKVSRRSPKLRRKIIKVRRAIRFVRTEPRKVAAAAVSSLVIQTLLTLLPLALARSSGLDISWTLWLMAWSLAKVASLLPIAQAGIGTREMALVAVLAPLGVAAGPTLAAGLAWECIIIGGGLAAGMISVTLGSVFAGATETSAMDSISAPVRVIGRKRGWVGACLALILMVAFGLRIWGVENRVVAHPENYIPGIAVPEWAKYPPPRMDVVGILESTLSDGHPPLYFLLMHPWIKVFGTGEFWIRFPSVLLGTLSVLLLYYIARRESSVRTALIAAALLALNGFHIYWSQKARMYVFAGFLCLLSTWLLYRILEDRRFRFRALYVLVTASALLTQLYCWPFLFAQMVWCACRSIARRRPNVAFGPQIVSVIIGLPTVALAIF